MRQLLVEVQPEYLWHVGEVEVVQVGGDDELSESDEDAELTMLNLILVCLRRLLKALRIFSSNIPVYFCIVFIDTTKIIQINVRINSENI